MEFKEFEEYVKESIQRRYPEALITVNEVIKNNGFKRTGIAIMHKEEIVSPTIYLEGFYNRLLDNENIEVLIEEMIDTYERNRIHDTEFIRVMDFDFVKDKIAYKLINYSKNEEMLKDMPYRRWNNLAIVYYISLGVKEDLTGSCVVNNGLMKNWNTSEEELYRLAKNNTPVKVLFKSMADIVRDMKDRDDLDITDEMLDDTGMYVLSNITKVNGASVILYDGVLQTISGFLEADLIIIPSSVHEVIIMRYDSLEQAEYVNDMVRQVNGTLCTEDILSDNAYRYIREKNETVIIE